MIDDDLFKRIERLEKSVSSRFDFLLYLASLCDFVYKNLMNDNRRRLKTIIFFVIFCLIFFVKIR